MLKYFFYICLLILSLVPLFSETFFGRKGRFAFYRLFQSSLSATSQKLDLDETHRSLKSLNTPGTKILEEDFDEQENSDDEQENEELEEDA